MRVEGVFSCHSTALYLWTFSLLGFNKIHYNLDKASNKQQKFTFLCFAAGMILSELLFFFFTFTNLNLKAQRVFFLLVCTAHTIPDYNNHSIITHDHIISISLAA